MAVTLPQLEQLYLAYFGRPADFDGVQFYMTSGSTLEQVEWAFANSAESQALYGTSYGSAFVNAIYNNLFNRDAEPAGLAYWVQQIADGAFSPAAAALVILQAAKNDDALTIQNKLAAATEFTHGLDNAPLILSYQGDAAAGVARDWLGSVGPTAGSLTDAMTALPTTYATVQGVGGITGDTFQLTNGADDVVVSKAYTIDTVKGIYFSDPTRDTFSIGDSIQGNGKTDVEILVADASTPALPFVTMSGVHKLGVTMGVAGTVTADASTWGTDIGAIALAGKDGSKLVVENLDTTQVPVDVSIAASTQGHVTLTSNAMVQGLGLSVALYNSDDDAVGAHLTAGVPGVDLVLGQDDTVSASIFHSANAVKAAATVGDLGVGHVDATVGQGADATLAFWNKATAVTSGAATAGSISVGAVDVQMATSGYFDLSVTNAANAAKGNATAGNLTLGDLTLAIGKSADASVHLHNSAFASNGAATVGSVTVGNVDVTVGDTGYFSTLEIYNKAESDKGAATAGNITIGNITSVGATNASTLLDMNTHNQAYAVGAVGAGKDAVVGNTTLGNVTLTGADDVHGNIYVDLTQVASASVAGNATAGNITVGDIHVTLGNSVATSSQAYVTLNNSAEADVGNATVGNIKVGSVNVTVGSNNEFQMKVSNEASVSATGVAKAGTITIGNVAMHAGLDGAAKLYVSNTVNHGTGSTVGAFTIGNVAMDGSAKADLYFSVDVHGDAGSSIGNLGIGNVTMDVQNDGYLSLSLQETGGTLGDVTVGNIAVSAGSGASVGYFIVSASATSGSMGNVKVGDVRLALGKSAVVSSADWYLYAKKDIGAIQLGNFDFELGPNVQFGTGAGGTRLLSASAGGHIGNISIGDVTAHAAKSATFAYEQEFYAAKSLGDITLGRVTLTADSKAALTLTQYFHAGTDIGKVNVGDVTVLAQASAELNFYNEVTNAGTIGNLHYGAFDVGAVGKNAYANVFVSAENNKTSDIGTVTIGNLNLHASGTSARARLSTTFTSATNIGTVTVGNVAMHVTGSGDAWGVGTLKATATDAVGDVTVGSVSLNVNASGGATVTNAAYADYHVTVSGATLGAVKVGDVSIALANTLAATRLAEGSLAVQAQAGTSGGNVTLGNITVSAADVGATTLTHAAKGTLYYAAVTADSAKGNVTVGNIKVSGGYTDGAASVLDDLSNLTGWLHLSAGTGKTVTLGNVDYSGYVAAATIDLTGTLGALHVAAAQGDTAITDNLGQNIITLGAGNDTVTEQQGQKYASTWATDSTVIDTLIGFAHGKDHLVLNTSTGAGSSYALNMANTGYADFVTKAGNAMTNLGYEVVTGVVGGSTYVAVDENHDGTVDNVVKLAGVTNIDATDLTFV